MADDSSQAGYYPRGEVLWLLSITREDAIDYDASQRDSCAGLTHDSIPSTDATDAELPVIARWVDVHRARREVVADKRNALLVALRANGHTLEETAAAVQLSPLTIRKRLRATVDDVLAELGGALQQPDALPHPPACIICGRAPRARLAAVVRRRRGQPPRVVRGKEERDAMVCERCLKPPELRARLIARGARS